MHCRRNVENTTVRSTENAIVGRESDERVGEGMGDEMRNSSGGEDTNVHSFFAVDSADLG